MLKGSAYDPKKILSVVVVVVIGLLLVQLIVGGGKGEDPRAYYNMGNRRNNSMDYKFGGAANLSGGVSASGKYPWPLHQGPGFEFGVGI